jgi:hypothetical protein
MSASGAPGDIEAGRSNVRFQTPKISSTLLNSSKEAHLKNMSTIQTDEHLQALTPVHYVIL